MAIYLRRTVNPLYWFFLIVKGYSGSRLIFLYFLMIHLIIIWKTHRICSGNYSFEVGNYTRFSNLSLWVETGSCLGMSQINYLFILLLKIEEQFISQMTGFGSRNKKFILCFYLHLDFGFIIYFALTKFLRFLITSFYLLFFSFSLQFFIRFDFQNLLQTLLEYFKINFVLRLFESHF